VQRTLWEAGSERLLLGRDDALGRDVWLHASSTMDSGTSPGISDAPLRRIWTGNDGKERWVAYEAPPGSSFLDLVAARGKLRWSELAPLVAQLLAALEDGGTGVPLDRLWVDGFQRLRIAPFPCPHGIATPLVGSPVPSGWRETLREAIQLGLGGGSLFR
jgi:hypothetical protein